MAVALVYVPGSGWTPASSSNIPSVVDVTDGTTSVTGVTTIDFTSGATVTDGGGGTADVAISGGGGVTSLDSITGAVSLVAGSNVTITDNSPSAGDITIAASASGSAGLVKLFEQTLSSDAASIDTGAGGIASGHGDLVCYFTGRATRAADNEGLTVRFNGDTGANYDYAYLRIVAGSPNVVTGYAQTQADCGQIPDANATTNGVGNVTLTIPEYDGTTFWKAASTQAAFAITSTTWTSAGEGGVNWHNTAAITRLSVQPVTGSNLLAGSRLVIYGTQ